jgi:hypothetical protein
VTRKSVVTRKSTVIVDDVDRSNGLSCVSYLSKVRQAAMVRASHAAL